MKKFNDVIIHIPDPEAMKKEHCVCFSCKNWVICRYRSKFIEQQQAQFPAKLECYKYELEEN